MDRCSITPRAWAWTSAGSAATSRERPIPGRIERDVAEGVRDGVNATPKFYVNGERIDGKVPLEGLVDAVQAALRSSRPG